MRWDRLLTGGCPACNAKLTTTNFGTRAWICEDQEGCGLSMLPWEHAAILTGMEKGYHTPTYKPKFGDDSLVLDWLTDPKAARARFLSQDSDA